MENVSRNLSLHLSRYILRKQECHPHESRDRESTSPVRDFLLIRRRRIFRVPRPRCDLGDGFFFLSPRLVPGCSALLSCGVAVIRRRLRGCQEQRALAVSVRACPRLAFRAVVVLWRPVQPLGLVHRRENGHRFSRAFLFVLIFQLFCPRLQKKRIGGTGNHRGQRRT